MNAGVCSPKSGGQLIDLGHCLSGSSHLQNSANKRAPDASRLFAEISSIILALVGSDGTWSPKQLQYTVLPV